MGMSVPSTRVYIDLSRLCMTPFTTGIQRVAKAVVTRMLQDPRAVVILLNALPSHTAWRVLPHKEFLAFCDGTRRVPYGDAPCDILTPADLESGSAFFEIDSAWNMPMHRGWLYPQLRQRGICVICHVYDLIPVTEPQYFHRNTAVQFWAWAGAVAAYADHVICNAQATKNALHTLCSQLDVKPPACTVIPLGGDFTVPRCQSHGADASLLARLQPYRYLLMVGTIEPRKNHRLVLDALPQLQEMGISVVFAGRMGWNMENFAAEMRKHPLRGKSFFFAESPDDATIQALYASALAVVFPTKNEGFGLPIAEAFCYGTPVLAADLPVLRESGGELAVYFDHNAPRALTEAVRGLLADPAAYEQLRARIAAYRPYTWDAAAAAMTEAICKAAPLYGTAKAAPLRQIAVLTARNADLLASLPFWDAYYPFAQEVLVCCPAANRAELQAKWRGRLHLRFCTDEELLRGDPLPKDHTKRNFFLRCRMLQYAPLDDVFLMTDDDYRPLMPIGEEMFRTEGRYCAYYCYDLRQWQGTQGSYTDYDSSMFRTCAFLQEKQLPTLQYSSHQPQIIDRSLYLALLEEYPHIITQGLDEWSVYFNYGVARAAAQFKPMRYCTVGWPGAMTDWPLFVMPEHLYFENFYGILYEAGQVFADLPVTFDAENAYRITVQKLNRWHRLLRRFAQQLGSEQTAKAIYENCGAMPVQFMLSEDEAGAVRFALPQYTVMPCGMLSRITVQVPEALRLPQAVLQYGLQTADGGSITPMQRILLEKTEMSRPVVLSLLAPAVPINGLLVLEYFTDPEKSPVQGSTPCMIVALPMDTGKEFGC